MIIPKLLPIALLTLLFTTLSGCGKDSKSNTPNKKIDAVGNHRSKDFKASMPEFTRTYVNTMSEEEVLVEFQELRGKVQEASSSSFPYFLCGDKPSYDSVGGIFAWRVSAHLVFGSNALDNKFVTGFSGDRGSMYRVKRLNDAQYAVVLEAKLDHSDEIGMMKENLKISYGGNDEFLFAKVYLDELIKVDPSSSKTTSTHSFKSIVLEYDRMAQKFNVIYEMRSFFGSESAGYERGHGDLNFKSGVLTQESHFDSIFTKMAGSVTSHIQRQGDQIIGKSVVVAQKGGSEYFRAGSYPINLTVTDKDIEKEVFLDCVSPTSKLKTDTK